MTAADLSVFFFFPMLVSRLRWKHTSSLKVANEPILAFTQGSPERDALQKVTGWGASRVCGSWDKERQEVPIHILSFSPGSEGPEGPDRSHPLCCRGRGGVDVQCAIPAVGRSGRGRGRGLCL